MPRARRGSLPRLFERAQPPSRIQRPFSESQYIAENFWPIKISRPGVRQETRAILTIRARTLKMMNRSR